MSSSIQLRKTGEGTLVPVRVVPRASRTGIDGVHDGSIRIRLKAPPVDGAANKELCAFLARSLGVSKGAVEIFSGERSRNKSVMVRGVEPGDVLELLRTGGS